VDIYQRAWHAGESSWAGRARCNDYSIGIELEGSDELPFTNRQYVALAGLIAELRARMPTIAPARIVGHCDVAPGRKSDPGPCFDWQRMARSLGA